MHRMHRGMRDHLEDVLAGKPIPEELSNHSEACREELAAMKQQAEWLRALRPPEEMEPRPGFYARVRERIEAQGAASIWNLFFDSQVGRRLAVASMALVLFLGVYLISSERHALQAGQPQMMFTRAPDTVPDYALPDEDTVLVNLVTYREQ